MKFLYNLMGDLNSNLFEKIILLICGILTASAIGILFYLQVAYPTLMF